MKLNELMNCIGTEGIEKERKREREKEKERMHARERIPFS